jgi:hypothetical protein
MNTSFKYTLPNGLIIDVDVEAMLSTSEMGLVVTDLQLEFFVPRSPFPAATFRMIASLMPEIEQDASDAAIEAFAEEYGRKV